METWSWSGWALALAVVAACGEPGVRGGPAQPRASACEALAIVPIVKDPPCDGSLGSPGLVDVTHGLVYLADAANANRGEAIDLASGRARFIFHGQLIAATCDAVYTIDWGAGGSLVETPSDGGARRVVREAMMKVDAGRVEGRQLVVGVDGWPDQRVGIGDATEERPAQAWRIDLDDGATHRAPIAGVAAPRPAPLVSSSVRFEAERVSPWPGAHGTPLELRALDGDGQLRWTRRWDAPIMVCGRQP